MGKPPQSRSTSSFGLVFSGVPAGLSLGCLKRSCERRREQGSSFYDCPDLQLRYLTWEAPDFLIDGAAEVPQTGVWFLQIRRGLDGLWKSTTDLLERGRGPLGQFGWIRLECTDCWRSNSNGLTSASISSKGHLGFNTQVSPTGFSPKFGHSQVAENVRFVGIPHLCE